MILVDTSVWIEVLRGASGVVTALATALDGEDCALTRFTELELLQGARDEREWALLCEYLEGQDYLETSATSHRNAARIYFELRRVGLTVRSPIDCLIAQLAIEHDLRLLHRDRDFEVIATLAPLRQSWCGGRRSR